MATTKVRCGFCNTDFDKENKEINRSRKRGTKDFCSSGCAVRYGNATCTNRDMSGLSKNWGLTGSDNPNWKGGISDVEAQYRSRRKYPERIAARREVVKALRRGDLTKATHCNDCPASEHLEAHHEDYNQPLNVEWLCIVCHRLRHPIDKLGRSRKVVRAFSR